jgi:uncharacterized protein
MLALDVPQGPILLTLTLAADATIGMALAQAQRQLQEQGTECAIDWEGAATGIWGIRRERDTTPRDGDRIELYRPLTTDPRARRRQRVTAARRS